MTPTAFAMYRLRTGKRVNVQKRDQIIPENQEVERSYSEASKRKRGDGSALLYSENALLSVIESLEADDRCKIRLKYPTVSSQPLHSLQDTSPTVILGPMAVCRWGPRSHGPFGWLRRFGVSNSFTTQEIVRQNLVLYINSKRCERSLVGDGA